MTTTMAAAAAYTGGPAKLPWDLPGRIRINEVGPRDGFQLERAFIPTDRKVAIVDALSATGVPSVQVTSFVRPDAVPQLADAAEVMGAITRVPEVEYAVLVPNLTGLRRALPFRPDAVETMLSVTDSHSLSNANRTTAAALESVREVVDGAGEEGIEVVGGMATALGCPFEGRTPYDRVAWVVGEYHDMGVRRVTVADTVGVADPAHVHGMCTRLRTDFPDVTFALHLHDTRGLGLANVLAGMSAGIVDFDASVGGLGGCPFAPGATGNITTEDLLHMCALSGIETGTELDPYLHIARDLVAPVIDHPLESKHSRAEPSWVTFPAPDRQQLDAG